VKNLSIKIITALLTFSLGIIGIWAAGGVTYLVSLRSSSDSTSQVREIHTNSSSVEIHKNYVLEQKLHFEDYPVGRVYKGNIAALKLSKYDESDRVRLKWAIDNQEVNFAGHYIVTTWSCGMWCSTVAIIDAKTGIVSWFPGVPQVCFPHLDEDFACDENFTNIEYEIDSSLIEFFGFGFEKSPDGERGFHYYKFERGRFIPLKSLLVKEQRNANQIQLDKGYKLSVKQ
jgi:hypothetical protein